MAGCAGTNSSIPPLETLLGTGLPNLTLMEAMLADIDSRLEENGQQLDSCLGDILKQANRLNGGKTFSTPKDALLYMADHHTLEKTTCYDPDLDEVLKFLKHVVRTLDESPGCEEIVLKELLMFSEQSGISLPVRSSTADNNMGSMASLHTVADPSEQAISNVWDKICLRLKKYFLDRLSKLPLNKIPADVDVNAQKRLEYIQSLCTLYSTEEVWEKYRNLRTQQLGKCFATLLSEGGVEDMDLVEAGNNCEELTGMIITMINEDFVLFNIGVFKRAIATLHALHDIYLDKFVDEMSALVDEIQDETACKANKGNKSMPQSHSEVGLHGSPTHLLVKAKTKSLDSMSVHLVEQPPSYKAPPPNLPQHYLKVVLQIVKGFLLIDNHMEDLHSTMAWEVGGVNSKKTKSRGSIRGVLKSSPSPDMMRRPMSALSYDSALSDTSTPSMDTSLSSTMSAVFKTPKVVEKTQVEDRPRWDWCHMFKKLSLEISQCMDYVVRKSRHTSLALDQSAAEHGHKLDTVPVQENLVGGKLDYPRVIFRSCMEFMSTLDSMLPLVRAGTDQVFEAARAAFVDTANLGLKDFHIHLTKLCSDVPRKTSVHVVYSAMSSAAYIRNHLFHYENLLTREDGGKKIFPLLYKQFVELVETLSKQVIMVHSQLISNSILFDPESHNWDDSKEFYENERCSFAIQMWNHHMQALRADLWSLCPPKLGQQMFSSVLHDSLDVLGRRYVRIKPSYRRTPQFRMDITAILLCVSELMFPACNSVSKYLDVSRSHCPHYSIHNQCCHLLAALAIVSSPLEVLYKVFKKGFTGKKMSWSDIDSLTEMDAKGFHSHWLSWILPQLILDGQKHYDDMQTTSAVYVQVKLLSAQPTPHWPMIIQAVVMKDFTLTILMLTSSVDRVKGQTTPQLPKGAEQTTQNTTDVRYDLSVKHMFDSFFYVLVHCSHFPDGVGRVVLPIINRCNDWELLATTAFPKGPKTPVWLESVYDLMSPFINRVLRCVLLSVVECQHYVPEIPPLTSVLQDLPCGCPLHKQSASNTKGKEGDQDVVEWCLRSLVSQVASSIELLPHPVYILFKLLQEAALDKKVKPAHHSVGLLMIAGCLRERLCSVSYIESVTGIQLRTSTRDMLASIGDSIYSTLCSNSTKPSTSTPRPAGAFKKHNKEWLSVKIDAIVQFLDSEMFEPTEGNLLDGSTQEFADQIFLTAATNILGTPRGEDHLQAIHNVIVRNRHWLARQLDIHSPLTHRSHGQRNSQADLFTLNMVAHKEEAFNPLTSFNKIGDWHMNHAAMLEFPYDWVRLLQCDLGLSEVGFHTLLYSRHEMQEGAFVEENQRKAVAVLKRQFNNEPKDLT